MRGGSLSPFKGMQGKSSRVENSTWMDSDSSCKKASTDLETHEQKIEEQQAFSHSLGSCCTTFSSPGQAGMQLYSLLCPWSEWGFMKWMGWVGLHGERKGKLWHIPHCCQTLGWVWMVGNVELGMTQLESFRVAKRSLGNLESAHQDSHRVKSQSGGSDSRLNSAPLDFSHQWNQARIEAQTWSLHCMAYDRKRLHSAAHLNMQHSGMRQHLHSYLFGFVSILPL